MTSLTISAAQPSTLYIFAISRPVGALSSHSGPSQDALIAELLGATVPARAAELINIGDLEQMSLSQFLTEGHDIPVEVIAKDAAKLNALDGYVLVLFSAGFDGTPVTLTPHSDLTLIGSYARARIETSAAPIPSDAAKPYSGTPDLTPATPPKGPAGRATLVVAVVTLLALILWWIFS